MTSKAKERSLKEIIGGGYKDFWECKKRYRLVKGSRGSKKSVTTAYWIILNMMAHHAANTLVVRRYGNTLRDSCYAVLNWAIEQLGFEHLWKATKSPLELTYLPTGQKILFRGLDDGLKITSITVTHGVLCWIWIEEAYELEGDADFNKLDLSLRGDVPPGLFKQITMTFNPWSEQSWLKSRFFDEPDDETFTKTTTYECNEWLDEADVRVFEKMREQNPRRFRIEGLGDWGISEGLIYENTECAVLDIDALKENPSCKAFFGLDFGFTDPTAFIGGFVNKDTRTIYICWELYLHNVTNQDIAREIKELGLHHERVRCDSAEPKSIAELRKAGVNAVAAIKGPDSVQYGIQKIQNFKIIYSPECPCFGEEIKNYTWAKDRQGNTTDKPDHEFSHGPDALRYALGDLRMSEYTVHPAIRAKLHTPRHR